MTEIRAQYVISYLYLESHIDGSRIPEITGISRRNNVFILGFGDRQGEDGADLQILPMEGDSSDVSDNGSFREITIELSPRTRPFRVSMRSNQDVLDRIRDRLNTDPCTDGMLLFPFPSHSCMSPFMRFLCMSHNLSCSSPVQKETLISSSIEEMSTLTIDETREQIRRSVTTAMGMMVSSGTIIENRYGVHIPRNPLEYERRYRRRFIPYHERIMKSTLFDF